MPLKKEKKKKKVKFVTWKRCLTSMFLCPAYVKLKREFYVAFVLGIQSTVYYNMCPIFNHETFW